MCGFVCKMSLGIRGGIISPYLLPPRRAQINILISFAALYFSPKFTLRFLYIQAFAVVYGPHKMAALTLLEPTKVECELYLLLQNFLLYLPWVSGFFMISSIFYYTLRFPCVNAAQAPQLKYFLVLFFGGVFFFPSQYRYWRVPVCFFHL